MSVIAGKRGATQHSELRRWQAGSTTYFLTRCALSLSSAGLRRQRYGAAVHAIRRSHISEGVHRQTYATVEMLRFCLLLERDPRSGSDQSVERFPDRREAAQGATKTETARK